MVALHLLEDIAPTPYIHAFVQALAGMAAAGNHEWIDTISCRLLNDPPHDKELIRLAGQDPAARAALLDVLRKTAQSRSKVAPLAAAAVAELSAQSP